MGNSVLASELLDYGLSVVQGKGIEGALTFETPAFVHDPRRMKNCSLGAFAYVNGGRSTTLYRSHLGRYAQIAEACIIGPPEHPTDWFSTHPFAFTRRRYLPKFYRLAEFERLAPDGSESTDYVNTVPSETYIGHEAYVGAGSFIKRGVRIGDGAVIGARSVVTRDVPAFAVVAGTPARIQRMRFSQPVVERLLALQWWHYDLAPFKHAVDFSEVESTLEFFESRLAAGELEPLIPQVRRVHAHADGFEVETGLAPLYAPEPAVAHPSLDSIKFGIPPR